MTMIAFKIKIFVLLQFITMQERSNLNGSSYYVTLSTADQVLPVTARQTAH